MPLVVNGCFRPGDPVIETVAREYLEPLRATGLATLILGCTPYPLLPEHLTEEIRRQTRARAGMALAKLTPAAELAAIAARLSQLQTYLKEVQAW